MISPEPQAHRQPFPAGEPTCTCALVSLYDIENNATRMMAAGLRRAGHRTIEIFFKDWINNHFQPPTVGELNALLSLLSRNRVRLVALSVRASAYHRLATQLTRLIRDSLGIPVLWGGTHVILDPEKCIREADMICVGEGDLSIGELLDCIAEGRSPHALPNLWLREANGTVVRNPVRDLVTDLDALPFRDYTSPDKFWIQGRKVRQGDPMVGDPVFQMMCSRGCVYTCAYCYNSQLAREVYRDRGRYYRFRSVSHVLEEIRQARSVFTSMKRIRFDDEVFVLNPEWIEEFLRRYPGEVGLPFEIFIEPRLVQPGVFERLKAAGLRVVYMGVQNTGRVNEEIYDRRVPETQILEAVSLFHQLGIDYRLQVIVDDPMSSDEDRRHLFDLLMSFPQPFELYLFSIIIFPNTALARKLLELGLIGEDAIEGESTKTFQQIRVSLGWPRPPDETFWCCMLVLLTKRFLPRPFLRWLSHCTFFKKHPKPLVWFAQGCNMIKMAGVCGRLLMRGELTWTLIRRWARPGSMVSQ